MELKGSRALETSALCGLLLLTGCETPKPSVHLQEQALFAKTDDTYTSAQRDFIEGYYNAAVGEWPDITSVKLNLVEGNGKFPACSTFNPDGSKITDKSAQDLYSTNPEYCNNTSSINLSSRSLGGLVLHLAGEDVAGQYAITAFFIAHESAHAFQDKGLADYKFTAPVKDTAYTAYHRGGELQADCLAGQLVRSTTPQLVSTTAEILRKKFPSLENDPGHGSGYDRADNFLNGARGHECKFKGNIDDYPDLK